MNENSNINNSPIFDGKKNDLESFITRRPTAIEKSLSRFENLNMYNSSNLQYPLFVFSRLIAT